MALGAPEDFEIFDYFLYHFEIIAAEQLFITIVFQTKNKKIFHSTLLCILVTMVIMFFFAASTRAIFMIVG